VVVSFGWAAWALLRLVVHRGVAAVAALALTGSTPLVANAGANYADAVVASFVALGLLSLFVWLTREAATVFLVLAGVFLAAASLSKNEGLLFTLAAAATAIALARRFGRPLATVCGLAVAVLAFPLLWKLVDRLNGAGGAEIIDPGAVFDPDYVATSADRIPAAADAMLTELLDDWRLAVAAVLVAAVAAVFARAWSAAIFVALWASLSFSALVLVYFLSTAAFDWHLGTSADRVVFSIALGTATLAPALVGQAWERRPALGP